jgi:hypothetical protein
MEFDLNSLNVNLFNGANVDARTCSLQDDQQWIWNSTDKTVINKHNGLCLTVQQELEVWAGPVANNSQAVVLLNRGNIGSEPITVKWTDIGFPANKAANVRDLWARKDLGTFTGSFQSENIAPHSVMMLKITPKP